MKRFCGRTRMIIAIITLIVTTQRLIAPIALADADQSPPVAEQLHEADRFAGLVPKRLPRWPGGSKAPRVKA